MITRTNNCKDTRLHIHKDTSIINAHSCKTNVLTLRGRYMEIIFLQHTQTKGCLRHLNAFTRTTTKHKAAASHRSKHADAGTYRHTHGQQIGFMDADSELQNNVDATTEESRYCRNNLIYCRRRWVPQAWRIQPTCGRQGGERGGEMSEKRQTRWDQRERWREDQNARKEKEGGRGSWGVQKDGHSKKRIKEVVK